MKKEVKIVLDDSTKEYVTKYIDKKLQKLEGEINKLQKRLADETNLNREIRADVADVMERVNGSIRDIIEERISDRLPQAIQQRTIEIQDQLLVELARKAMGLEKGKHEDC